jgi:hypothetical protein
MREVTINGKTVTIESGLMPTPITGPGRHKTDLRLLVEALNDGESVFLPITKKEVESINLWAVGKALGSRFSYRCIDGGVRIYRLSKRTTLETVSNRRPNGARAVVEKARAWG